MKSREKRILRAYFICATPRTGSTLLQEALKFTNIAGNPLEYFGLGEEHWLKELEREPGETYMAKVLSSGTTRNGVFGAKILRYQFRAMLEYMRKHFQDPETPAAQFLDKHFSRPGYIWVRRRDKLAQAVSEAIASQTLIWQQVEYNAKKIPAKTPVFNFARITETLKAQAAFEAEWQQFFAENKIEPFVLDYEELVANYVEAIYKVLAFLDLPTNVPIRRPRLVKQADATSREWTERYNAMINEEQAAAAQISPAQAFELAVRFHKRRQLREAEAQYLALLRVDPEHVDCTHNLGLLRLEQGKPEEAAVLLARAVAKEPASARLLNNYGVAIDALKRHDEAVVHFTRALVLQPNYAECHNNLGNSLQMLGRFDEALQNYQKALALKPDYVDAHRNLGRALLGHAAASRARAIAHFERSLALKPEDAEAYCGLGMAHQALNHFDKALTYFSKAVALDPDHAEARHHLEATVLAMDTRSKTADDGWSASGKFSLQLADVPSAERGST
jgi:LPS sulfotransferase NodH/Flp pilus assembly protein TadD